MLIMRSTAFHRRRCRSAAMIRRTLVDPPATMVNASGDNVVAMMVAAGVGWEALDEAAVVRSKKMEVRGENK